MVFLDRTAKALGNRLMEQLKSLQFCIVGCGGTGANFAEMLVRSGANQVTLIDGGTVKESDLNRVLSFTSCDIDKPKVHALKERLLNIGYNLSIVALKDNFRAFENLLPDHQIGQQVRDAVYNADVVFIGTDTNKSRLAVESLCRDSRKEYYLSCGVHVEFESASFECNWKPKTPPKLADDEGYGPDNGSYVAVVQEAVSVGFAMLLHHLKCPEEKSSFTSYYREYDACFVPLKTCVNENPRNSIPSH